MLWKRFEIKSHQRRAHYLNPPRNGRQLAAGGLSRRPLLVFLGLFKYMIFEHKRVNFNMVSHIDVHVELNGHPWAGERLGFEVDVDDQNLLKRP